MKKYNFFIFLLSVFLINTGTNNLKAQCLNSLNAADSLEIERIKTLYNPLKIGYIDTLGECWISELHLSGISVTKFEVNFPYLKKLRFDDTNFIDRAEITGYSNLETLEIVWGSANNELIISNMPALKKIEFGPGDFSGKAITLENLDKLETLILAPDIYQPFNPYFFDQINVPNLKKLVWWGEFIPNISNFPKLIALEIHTPYSGFLVSAETLHNFSNFPLLQKLAVRYFEFENPITESNFDKLPDLKELVLQGSKFNNSPIPIFKNPKLEKLDLSGCDFVGSIPNFINTPFLRSLSLDRNEITGVIPNFEYIPLLETLHLESNQLTGIIPDFEDLPLLNDLVVCGENDFIEPIPLLENCPLLNTNNVDFTCVRPAPENIGCIASESDSLQLVNFYNSTNGDNWQVNTGWLIENVSSWWGVELKDTLGRCRVTKLLVRGISDTLNMPSINLPFLEELIVDYNNFNGTIPNLTNLTNLKVLNLGNNCFEGPLPDLSMYTKLVELDLSKNKLTGELPDFLNNQALKVLNLSGNMLTGDLPDFQVISNLNYLNVSGNQLTGNIPNFSNLPGLYVLSVANNQLTGGLPNFSGLPALQSLFVENNQLTGRIPNFNNIPLLEDLIVCDNNFEGTAPNFSFSTLLNVDAVDFSCLQAAKVKGYAYYDTNENCIYDDGDITLPNGLISINNGANYQPIDENGYFEIALEVGTSVITFIQTSPLWQSDCATSQTVTSININDITEINFANQPTIDCTQLTVNIGTPFLRRCFKNTYSVQYCNAGTQPAIDAYVEIDFEPEIVPLSASIPYQQNNNLFTFQLGEVGIGECGSFTIIDSVACTAPLSSTGCVEAHIFPSGFCFVPPDWDGANLAVNAFCVNNDSIQFIVENLGNTMDNPSVYRIYEEDVLSVQGELILPNGGSKVLNYPATGATYRVAVEQTQGHPSQNDAQAFFEFCGDSNFSTGYINSQLLPDADPFIDIDCEEIIGSYDPNDKLVTPTGVGDRNDIYIGDELTYKIRFQNTGNDTAFTIVLVDTLDVEHLDISTIEILNSSHPYALAVEDAQILTFTFNHILLVDSTTNEQASHGFVTFKVKQNSDNQIGDVIENKAYIYFDYNEAIVTPRVFSTLAEPRIASNYQFIPLITSIENQAINHLFAKVYPNPASDVFYIELPNEVINQYPNLQLEVYNVQGQPLLVHLLNKTKVEIDVSPINGGIYYYKLFSNKSSVAHGKLLIK